MPTSLRTYLPVLLLLVAVLLAPLNSIARELASGSAPNCCGCEQSLASCCTAGTGESPDHNTGSNNGDCCDTEECCPDSAEPPRTSALPVTVSAKQYFHPHSSSHMPQVYLAIFVPPESCS